MFLQQKLSEYHTGLRAFSGTLLAGLPFERNSDNFVFDNQILAQAIAARGEDRRSIARLGTRPTHPRSTCAGASSPGLGVLRTCGQYRLHKRGLRHYPYLDFDAAAAGEGGDGSRRRVVERTARRQRTACMPTGDHRIRRR